MGTRACPPPHNFNPVGDLVWVRPLPYQPPFINRRKPKGRKAQGVRYEQRAHAHFRDLYGERYIHSQWFQFQEAGLNPRYCELDGLLIRPKQGRLILLEMKYSHTANAWWQTRKLYSPILRFLFPAELWELSVCEVTKWYDPAVAFPEPAHLIKDIRDSQPGKFGIHIWKP